MGFDAQPLSLASNATANTPASVSPFYRRNIGSTARRAGLEPISAPPPDPSGPPGQTATRPTQPPAEPPNRRATRHLQDSDRVSPFQPVKRRSAPSHARHHVVQGMIDHPVRLHAPSPNLPLRGAQRRTQIETALQCFLAASLPDFRTGFRSRATLESGLPSGPAPITEYRTCVLSRSNIRFLGTRIAHTKHHIWTAVLLAAAVALETAGMAGAVLLLAA